MDMFDRLIAREGGEKITRDPSDPGGLTKFGISQRSYPDLDIANLTYEGARAIYVRDFYQKPHLDMLPLPWQEPVLDWAVHSGPQMAIRALQRLAGVPEDGILGPQTVQGLQRAQINDYAKLRVVEYCRQVQKNPQKVKFLTGWVLRALQFLS